MLGWRVKWGRLVIEDVSKRGVNGEYSLLTNHLVPLHFLNQTPERHLGMEPPPLPVAFSLVSSSALPSPLRVDFLFRGTLRVELGQDHDIMGHHL
jgi:hypothetical protein